MKIKNPWALVNMNSLSSWIFLSMAVTVTLAAFYCNAQIIIGGYFSNKEIIGTRRGRTYTDVARVINPNPYAFVGAQPYPAQPFWPHQGG